MVAIEKEYVFEGPDGKVALADLFDGSRQLIVQHVMFGPDWDRACPGCTAGIYETSDGMRAHLKSRDTNFVLVSRAPQEKLRQQDRPTPFSKRPVSGGTPGIPSRLLAQ
jgi:predicted dithiol-disulfide oxidoreductase (DUF899 family)